MNTPWIRFWIAWGFLWPRFAYELEIAFNIIGYSRWSLYLLPCRISCWAFRIPTKPGHMKSLSDLYIAHWTLRSTPTKILVRHLTGSLTPSNYLVLGMIMSCMRSSFLRYLTPFSVTGRCSRLGLEGMALQFFEQNCSCKHVHKGRSNLFLALFTFLHILTYLWVKL